jgi:hypothetical protein
MLIKVMYMHIRTFIFIGLLLISGWFFLGEQRKAPLHAQSGDTYIYLPLVQRPGMADPTPTPPGNLPIIPNGDFEMGSTMTVLETAPNVVNASLGWQELRSLSNRPLIVQSADTLPVAPRSGNWFAWLGGDHYLGETTNHRSHLVHWDHFFLPANQTTYLHLYYQIISNEQPNKYGVCDRDLLNLWMNNILVQQAQVCEQTQTNGWTKAVIDLTPLAGQWVTLEFEMRTDFQNTSHFFIDDVSFQSTP